MPGRVALVMLACMGWLKLIGFLLGAYALFVLLVALLQTPLLFPRWAMGAPPPLPAGAERLELERPGGVVLHGQIVRAEGGEGRPLLLGFGGNAWDAVSLLRYMRDVLPGHNVASFHFRGYSPSTGRPSASALLEDALAVHDHLQAEFGPHSVLAVGFSIGSGPAAHLAARRDLAGAVLVTPFASLTDVARGHYPWLPVRWLFRHPMAPAEDLAGSDLPLALIWAARDAVVPARHARALAEALAGNEPGVVFAQEIDADHNDIYGRADFQAVLREAVARVEAVAAGR